MHIAKRNTLVPSLHIESPIPHSLIITMTKETEGTNTTRSLIVKTLKLPTMTHACTYMYVCNIICTKAIVFWRWYKSLAPIHVNCCATQTLYKRKDSFWRDAFWRRLLVMSEEM